MEVVRVRSLVGKFLGADPVITLDMIAVDYSGKDFFIRLIDEDALSTIVCDGRMWYLVQYSALLYAWDPLI